MENIEIQRLYKSTFGSVKNDEQSLSAFIDLLLAFEIINNDEYTSAKSSGAQVVMNERIKILLSKKLVPLFENITDEIDKESYKAIQRKLDECEYVVVYDKTGQSEPLKFKRDYNEFGSTIWVCLDDDKKVEYEEELMINTIYDKVFYNMYSLSKHGKYLDVGKPGDGQYFDKESMENLLTNFYNKIFGSNPVLDEDWNKYLNFVEKAGIITGEQKIQMIKHGDK